MNFRKINNNILEIIDDENNVILSIEETLVEGILIIYLKGTITNKVSHEFEDELMAALTVCSQIKLDFSGVTYIASMALRSLLSAQQIIDDKDDSSLVLINVQKPVMDIFKESGFSEILSIETE